MKPFDHVHPLRGVFGDPRTAFDGPPITYTMLHGGGAFSFHHGIDIVVPGGTRVYPVRDGVVTLVKKEWIVVASPRDHTCFEYWHIAPTMRRGERVVADRTVIGTVLHPADHVDIAEHLRGAVVNPLRAGALTPYRDETTPRIDTISIREANGSTLAPPDSVRGRAVFVANASDMPTIELRGAWHELAVVPAKLAWRIQTPDGRAAIAGSVAVDFRRTIPPNRAFWNVYARGTMQNRAQFGSHHAPVRGTYLFKLTPSPFDTHRLENGVYDVVVTASDVRGNAATAKLRFAVRNTTSLGATR